MKASSLQAEHAQTNDFDEWRHFNDRDPDDASPGPARAVEVTGRCVSCWGHVTGRKSNEGRWETIECQVCGQFLDDDRVEREVTQMYVEAEQNLPLARVGQASNYRRDAAFVLKLLPDMDRDTSDFEQCITATLENTLKRNRSRLNRRSFPPGTAGYLYAQARTLLEGLRCLPTEMSAIDFSDFDFDESKLENLKAKREGDTVTVSALVSVKKRKQTDQVVLARVGTALLAGMTASFACEVGLKAILVTRCHEAEKTHDLLSLYKALPSDCKKRLQADYPDIANVLERHRHVFSRWRYFEENVGEEAMLGLVNTDRVRELAHAGRVIMDECVISGLQFKLDIELDGQLESDSLSWAPTVGLSVMSEEAAIPWDAILSRKHES